MSLSYFKKTLMLKSEVKTFYGVPIGLHKEYDENGQIVKTTNCDSLNHFSVSDLVKAMKKRFNIDLLKLNRRTYISRNVNSDYRRPVYHIRYPNSDMLGKEIIIDGNNGKTLSDKDFTIVE